MQKGEVTLMITLNLSPQKQAIIEQASQAAGMSIEQYILSKILTNEQISSTPTAPKRQLGFMKGEMTIPDDIHWGDEAVEAVFKEYL